MRRLVVWALVAAAGCGREGIAVDAGVDSAPIADAPGVRAQKLDVLFMIDDSAAMVDLGADYPIMLSSFLEPLRQRLGGLPDLHVGVVTSDLGAGIKPLANGGCPVPGGDRGILQARPACGLTGGARFLTSAGNGTVNNFTGPMQEVFECMAKVGIAGCGYEHQLQSLRVALDESVTTENQGFLRDDAVLAIIMFTDEDDCSAEPNTDLFTDDASFANTTASFRCSQVGHVCNGMSPPQTPFDVPLESCQANPAGRLLPVRDIVASIRARKADPDQQLFVAGFFGWPLEPAGARYQYINTNQGLFMGPICQSHRGEAAVGLRLQAFVQSFGPTGFAASICDPDYRPTLQRLGQAVATRF